MGYAIDVTFYKMTVLVKGTRFPEGSGLTFFSLFFPLGSHYENVIHS